MGKILKNALAYINGLRFHIYSLFNKRTKIDINNRVFVSADVSIDRGAKMMIDKNVKIRERSVVAVRKGAELTLGKDVSVGMENKIVCHEQISIGEGTLLSPNVLIYDHDHVFDFNGVRRKEFKTRPVIIGKNCWIGANTVILRGTELGDNCVVGAGSVIKGSYPDGSIIIQERKEIIKKI